MDNEAPNYGRSVISADFRKKIVNSVTVVDETLKGGGGGGTSDDMEARVARLEKNFDTLTKDVSDMRVDVATLKENVRHLPTKPWMFSTLVAMLAALSVVIGLIVRFIPHAP